MTVARDVFAAVLYLCGIVLSLAIAGMVLMNIALEMAANFRGRRFSACGIHDMNDWPCMLPTGHREREHATAWRPSTLVGVELRHRFDDVTAEGRTERRTAPGILRPVTRTGDVVDA